jgi:hypothetical protein
VVYLVQRIIVNSYGWARPSPSRLGPVGEGEYVRKNGFGHEDWNFNLDLAIREHIYGYAYYEPAPAKAPEKFRVAFVTYTDHRWRLVGFYLDAEFIEAGAPTNRKVLRAKLQHLLALKPQNSLGQPWANLSNEGVIRKLEGEARWLRWKVHIKDALRLPQPVSIPERIFESANYRITRPTEIDAATFTRLRALAKRTALPG